MMLIRSVVEAGEPFFGSRVVEPMPLIRTHLANHIRASSREEWLHLQARHMTAPDRNRHHANSALDAGAVAVGTRIAPRPPHRSRRALLTHRAPTLDGDEEPLLRPRMQDAWEWQVAIGDRLHPSPRQPTPLAAAHESAVPAFDHVVPEG
jgi:hypothetical protein